MRYTVSIAVALSVCVCTGRQVDEGTGGRWSRRGSPHVPDQDVIEMLQSLQYLQGYEPAPDEKGVVVYDRDLACGGLNLIVSGHAPEAFLADMEGRVVHRWGHSFDNIWEDGPPDELSENTGRNYWRRVRLLPDGSLLAVFEGQCLIKLDRDSRLLWVFPEQAHHDIEIDQDGTVYTLVRDARIDTLINPSSLIVADYIVSLAAGGTELQRVSLVECFRNSTYSDIVPKGGAGDIFHTNSVRVLDGTLDALSPLFARGNILTSLCATSSIAIVDPGRRRVVWAQTGPWVAQHDPRLLEDGNILLFDNLGREGSSRVVEYNPLSGRIEWVYPTEPDAVLHSRTCGTCQRLANGNTLITESDSGRAIEVTRDGTIVWEYVNPHRAGDENELIATLLDVTRIVEKPEWLGREGGGFRAQTPGLG
jgi:hypothetical protein